MVLQPSHGNTAGTFMFEKPHCKSQSIQTNKTAGLETFQISTFQWTLTHSEAHNTVRGRIQRSASVAGNCWTWWCNGTRLPTLSCSPPQSCPRSKCCGGVPQTVLSTQLLRTSASLCGRTELQLTGSIPANCIETKHVTPDHSHKFVSLKQQFTRICSSTVLFFCFSKEY